MGFLSKLKKKVGTGGVKVQLTDVPAAITIDAGSVEVGVTITATDEAQSFTNVFVALDLVRTTSQNNGVNQSFGNNSGVNQANQQQTNRYVLARVDLGPTDIAVGETRNYTVTLPTDALAGGNRAVELGDSPLANAAEGLLKMSQSGQIQDRYELHAVAELDGMRDPKDTQQVNVVGAANQGHFGFRLGS